MSSHGRFPEMLSRRAELTTSDEEELQRHLAACPECRRTATAYERQTALLRSLPPLDPPPALRAGVLGAIRNAPPPVLWYRRRMALGAPMAAALAIALVALVWGARSQGGSQTALRANATPTVAVPASSSSLSSGKRAHPPLVAPARPTAPTSHPMKQPRAHTGGSRTAPAPTRASRVQQTPASLQPTATFSRPLPATTHPAAPLLATGPRPTPTAARAGAPAVASRPTPRRGITFGTVHPTSRPRAKPARPTPRPTTGPVGIAAGPLPTAAPPAPAPPAAPIRPSPAPSIPSPATTPAPVATPATGSIAAPVPAPATPPPPAVVRASPLTPTPTPTPTVAANP